MANSLPNLCFHFSVSCAEFCHLLGELLQILQAAWQMRTPREWLVPLCWGMAGGEWDTCRLGHAQEQNQLLGLVTDDSLKTYFNYQCSRFQQKF